MSAQRGGGDARRNYDTGAVHDYKREEVKDDDGVKSTSQRGSMFNHHLSSAFVLYLFIGPNVHANYGGFRQNLHILRFANRVELVE